ncbi:MAG: KH domain-containing protein [Clostridia bacterium]|nr:KH domain-containing protein [Clostridia bacterium]
MKEYISFGKNVDIAIEEGLRSLGLTREDVDIKILETGGLFKKAKVCLMYEEKQEEQTKVEEIVEETKPVEIVEEVEQTEDNNQNIEEEIKVSEDVAINEEVEETKEAEVEVTEIKKVRETKVVSPEQLIDRVKQFLTDLAKNMKLEVEVEYEINENDLSFNIKGQNVGKLIGFRGETLNAIQVLLGGLRRSGEGKYRVYLDIENYKKAREQTLVDLANKMADKAEEIERNVHLDPMSAYERRIVHSALQNRTLVETESMGEGEKRHVVIKFKR